MVLAPWQTDALHNNTILIYYPLCWKKAEGTQVAFFPRSRPTLQLPIAKATARAACPPQNKVSTVSERTERMCALRAAGSLFSVYRGSLICRLRCQGDARLWAHHWAIICQPALPVKPALSGTSGASRTHWCTHLRGKYRRMSDELLCFTAPCALTALQIRTRGFYLLIDFYKAICSQSYHIWSLGS